MTFRLRRPRNQALRAPSTHIRALLPRHLIPALRPLLQLFQHPVEPALQGIGDFFSDDGEELERMPAAARGKEKARVRGMEIDEEIRVWSVEEEKE